MLKEKMNAALAHVREVHGVKSNKDFAGAIGMATDRLGNIVNGKIKKLQRDEAVAIERAYGIRSAWWFSDIAPMLLTAEERVVQPHLADLANASAEVLSLGLSGWQASFVQELLFNVRQKDARGLQRQLESIGPKDDVDTHGNFAEVLLLGEWRRCNQDDKATLLKLANRLAETGLTITRDDTYFERMLAAPVIQDKPNEPNNRRKKP